MSLPEAKRSDKAAYPATGLIGGLLSGLLGIGGGTVMVPLLALWARQPQRTAHAVSLAAIIPISIAAVAVYGGAGKVDVLAAAALAIGAVAGARIGAGILAGASERGLKTAFGVFMYVAALSILVKG